MLTTRSCLFYFENVVSIWSPFISSVGTKTVAVIIIIKRTSRFFPNSETRLYRYFIHVRRKAPLKSFCQKSMEERKALEWRGGNLTPIFKKGKNGGTWDCRLVTRNFWQSGSYPIIGESRNESAVEQDRSGRLCATNNFFFYLFFSFHFSFILFSQFPLLLLKATPGSGGHAPRSCSCVLR